MNPSAGASARGNHRIAEILSGRVTDIVKVRPGRGFSGKVAPGLAAHEVPAEVELTGFLDVQTTGVQATRVS